MSPDRAARALSREGPRRREPLLVRLRPLGVLRRLAEEHGFEPVKRVVEAEARPWFRGCKGTSGRPLCDGAQMSL